MKFGRSLVLFLLTAVLCHTADADTQIAFSQKLGVEIYAASPDWCSESPMLKVVAKGAQVFDEPEFAALVKRLGRRVLGTGCPAAKTVQLVGSVGDAAPVWHGTAAASDAWALKPADAKSTALDTDAAPANGGSVAATPQASDAEARPVPFDPILGQLIQAKLYQTEPDYEHLTAGIAKDADRARRIAELQQRFKQLDLTQTFRTGPTSANFHANTQKGILSTGWDDSSQLPIASPRQAVDSAGIAFVNAKDIEAVPLASIDAQDSKNADKKKHDTAPTGSMIFEFTILGLDRVATTQIFPTVQPAPRQLASQRIMAFVTKLELYADAGSRKIFEERFQQPPPPPAPAEPAVPPYSSDLALHGHAQDFDIRGLKLSMTMSDVRKYAFDNHLPLQSVVDVKGAYFIPEGACLAIGGSASLMPTANDIGASCLIVEAAGEIVSHISYQFRTNEPTDQLAAAILTKYGMPLVQTDGVYYWGDKMASAKGAHVFSVAITPPSATSDPGTYVSIDVRLPRPPAEPVIAPKL